MRVAGGLVYSGASSVFNPVTDATLPPYPLTDSTV
jgi:hypothetical protein